MTAQYKKIDDAELQEMAAEPVRPLFGVLQHASAMVPWVILLALLPPLYAVANRPLTDVGARWGVKALKSASARSFGEAVDPGVTDEAIPYRWQPPLISWLSGFAAWSLGTWSPSAVMLAPFAATAGFLWAAYLLACRIGDDKLGLLTVFVLAFQGEVLASAQFAAPVAAGLCCAILVFWAYLGHLKHSETVVSAHLMFAGIALGVCLLAGGPLAIVVLVTLLLHILGMKFPLRRSTDQEKTSWHKSRTTPPTFLALGVMTLTAFAVGGWWELMMAYTYGNSFWLEWFQGDAADELFGQPADGKFPLILPRDVGEMLLILAGPALYGLWRAVREIALGKDPYRVQVLQLLVFWSVVAGIMWQCARTFHLSADAGEAMWRGFLLSPLLILASWGILQIADGRAGSRAVALIGLVTAANLIWNAPPNLAGTRLLKMFILMILIGALSVVASLSPGFRHRRREEGRQSRLLETILVLMMLAGHCVWGLASVARTNEQDKELVALSRVLSQINQRVVGFTIITPQAKRDTPPQLEYLAKTTWPTVSGQTVRSWEEAQNWKLAVAEEPIPDPSNSQDVHVFMLWDASLVPFPAADGRREIARFNEYYRHRQVSVLVLPATGY